MLHLQLDVSFCSIFSHFITHAYKVHPYDIFTTDLCNSSTGGTQHFYCLKHRLSCYSQRHIVRTVTTIIKYQASGPLAKRKHIILTCAFLKGISYSHKQTCCPISLTFLTIKSINLKIGTTSLLVSYERFTIAWQWFHHSCHSSKENLNSKAKKSVLILFLFPLHKFTHN